MFNYTDHLGNVRLSYTQDTNGSLKILEENDYYPFGLKHETNGTINYQPFYKYKYNGKELQDELGLNMYDYGARNYDPAIGRWMNIDPLAETSRRFSPYAYALNNPVYFIDPDGMEAETFFKSKFLNENGGHWSDGYKGESTSEKSGKDGDSGNEEAGENNAESQHDGNGGADNQDPPGKKKVLEAKKTLLGKLWGTLEPREWQDPETGVVYQVNADGTILRPRPLGGAGGLGFISGGVGGAGSILKFKGLVQNLSLRGLTHQQLVRAFEGTEFTLSSHAIKRLKDIRTSNLGFSTLNDIKQIFNKGTSFDAGGGAVGKAYKGLEVIWNAETKVIITVRPAKIR